jgi:hypothetical protein
MATTLTSRDFEFSPSVNRVKGTGFYILSPTSEKAWDHPAFNGFPFLLVKLEQGQIKGMGTFSKRSTIRAFIRALSSGNLDRAQEIHSQDRGL